MYSSIKFLSTKSGKSVVLTVESKSYIFNLFEGFQRYCIESKVHLKNICAIFIPDKKCIPPLCGLYLTLRDMNVEILKIVCNSKIQLLIKKAYTFCPPNKLQIQFYDLNYDDEFISVSKKYILQIKKFKGRFRVENVPSCIPKFMYKDLVAGKKVQINDKVYNGDDYMEPDIKFKKIYLIIDDTLTPTEEDKVICFKKKDFLRYQFRDLWYINNPKTIDFISQYNLLSEFSKISSNFLLPSLPRFRKKISRRKSFYKRAKWKHIFLFTRIINSNDCFIYNKEIKDFVLHREPRKILNYSNDNFLQYSDKDSFVLTLGSGCAIPSKYRNVSCLLVSIKSKVFLFDCGEDSLNQLLRLNGSYKVLQKIGTIFISHSHGDHNLGLINLLSKIKHKVNLFAPQCILDFVSLFNENIKCFATDSAKELEQNYYKSVDKKSIDNYILHFTLDNFVFVSICGCKHNLDSCSVSIEYKNIKISYSGDTRPSCLFADMACNSDILIHESTFDNENEEKAIKTNHSTLNDAYNIFLRSKSKVLLLTHFSQRYSKKFDTYTLGIPCYDFYKYTLGKSKTTKELDEFSKNM